MTLDLTELKKRFQPQSVLALTVESDRIVVSLIRRGSAPLPPLYVAVTVGALLEDPVKAGTALVAALEAAEIRERRCVVCLPTSWALSASADMPEVVAEDLRGYFELRAEREFSTSDLRLAHNPYCLADGTRRATLAALPSKRMEAVEKMLETAHCHPVSISLALRGCLSKAEPTLHLLADGAQTDVLISSGGGIAALRTLTSPVASDPAAFARELRITLGRLPEAVRAHLRHARLVGWEDSAPRETLARMGFDPIEETSGEPGGAAVECAELFLREQPVPFEFLVPEVNRWPAMLERFNTRRGRQIAAVALALILLPLLAFSVLSLVENHYDAQWNGTKTARGMKDTAGELEAIQQKIRQFRPWFEATPQKLKALDTLILAFPERGDVWTRSVQIGAYMEKSDGGRTVQSAVASKVSVAGFARNNTALLALQERLRKQPGVSAVQLQQVRGNNPLQFSLVYKWEPKHEN